MKLNSRGFMIPELLATIAITTLFSGLIMTFTFSYWRFSNLLEADQDTLTSRLNAGDILRENLSQSSGLIIQNSIPDNNTHKPDPTNQTEQYWEPIHAIPGEKTIGTDKSPLLYFRRLTQSSDGNFIMNGSNPFEDEYIIYFDADSKQLLLRTLANPVAGNKRRTSCPAALASSVCPADRVIVDDLKSVEMRYFSRAGNTIDHTSMVDPINPSIFIGPDFTVVEVVELTLNLSKKPALYKTNEVQNSTIIRVALRNS
jgi:Tfp pilus assembly protein FimT